MPEHIIVTALDNGLLRLTPEAGYRLYNPITNLYHSEAIVKSIGAFIAVVDGVDPRPHERTLEDAILERIALLRAYDQSEDVLSFTFAGQRMWLNPSERTNFLMTINAAEDIGMTEVPFKGMNVPIAQARAVLNAVALYAMQTMAVTDAHEATLRRKRSIVAVDNYDYTAGYPEKLVFAL